MRSCCAPHRVIRNKVGINVPSKPRKSAIRFLAVKVITRKKKIVNINIIKIFFFWYFSALRWPVLAIMATGVSHTLK